MHRKPRRQFWEEDEFLDDVDPDLASWSYHSEETIHWTVSLLKDLDAMKSCKALEHAESPRQQPTKGECSCRSEEHKHTRVWKVRTSPYKSDLKTNHETDPTSSSEPDSKLDPNFYSVCEEKSFEISYVNDSELGKGDGAVKEMPEVNVTEIQLLERWFDLELRTLQSKAKAGAKKPNTVLAKAKSWLWDIFDKEYEESRKALKDQGNIVDTLRA
jgi:hypothetical protein